MKKFKFILSIITAITLFFIHQGCKEDEFPSIETAEIIEIGHKSAKAGGDVTSGENLSYRGLCWGTNERPTIENDRHTSEGTTNLLSSIMGPFTHKMTSLSPGTTYYYRAYVNNTGSQIAYGHTYSFTTLPSRGTVTDIEGNVYQTAQIGNQLWMAENLRSTHYLNGDEIPTTDPDTLWLGKEDTTAYQWAYNGDESLVADYGRLYNWYAITNNSNVCPSGWHVPTDNEWNTLIDFLGGDTIALPKMKEDGAIHWEVDLSDGNSSDFTAVPGGSRSEINGFYGLRSEATYWSSLTYPNYGDYYGYELWNYSEIGILRCWGDDVNTAFSVRCIKNQ